MRVHLINLDRSVDRLAEFQKRNAHLREVIRFSGVEGDSVDKASLVKDGIITEELAYPPGTLGCALSHIRLWEKAVSENTIVTIFEDDTIASSKFDEKATEIISKLPEGWDLIKWGHNFWPCFVWLDFGYSKAKLEFYDRRFSGENRLKFQSTDFSPFVVRLAHSFGLMAYSVSPSGARILLEYCLPLRKRLIPFPGTPVVLGDLGIDCAANGAFTSMQAFVCIPPLVIHDDDLVSNRLTRNAEA